MNVKVLRGEERKNEIESKMAVKTDLTHSIYLFLFYYFMKKNSILFSMK